jgi:ABC-2 type transport system permease protein
VFISYGIAYKTGFFFYGNVMLSLLSLSIIASGIGAVLVMVAVVFIPANRMKTVFIFIGLCCFLILFFAFRFLRPERLVDPEVFANALIYLKALKTPLPGYLPSTWVYDILTTALSGQLSAGLLHVMLLVSCTGFMICLVVVLADMVYFTGLSKSRTAAVRLFKHREISAAFVRFLPRQVAAFVRKEIKIFWRDQTQWTQVILIGALIVVYIYNFKVLPLEKAPIKTFYLQNLLSFLNMGLAGFVLIAVTARFAYPAVSTEQEAIWIVRSVPISLGNYLWIKFFIYFIPLLGLTELLIIATNILLKVTPFMMALSTVNVLFMVPGIVSMGIGFGAGYPNFKSENPAQAVTGLGGLLFMMACAGYLGAVIMLEAGPVYSLFMANITQKALSNLEWAWIVGSFALVFLISILVITLPMKFGERRLAKILA